MPGMEVDTGLKLSVLIKLEASSSIPIPVASAKLSALISSPVERTTMSKYSVLRLPSSST